MELTSESTEVLQNKNMQNVKGPLESEAEESIIRAMKEDNEAQDMVASGKYKLPPKITSNEVDLYDDAPDPKPMASPRSEPPGLPSLQSDSRSELIQTQEEDDIRRHSIPPEMQPIEPTTSTPQLKDIVHRMNLMHMATRRATTDAKDTEYLQSHQDNSILPGDDTPQMLDPESLQPRLLEIAELPAERSKFDVNWNGQREPTTFCRHHCGPCYSFFQLIRLNTENIKTKLKVFLFVLIPLLSIAAIIFYFADNPLDPRGVAYSWWLQFAARQSITYSLARVTEIILIDFIALETRIIVLTMGQMLTLMAMQAKGWPIVAVFWSVWNFALLYGNARLSHHWLYWQDKLEMFNDKNPSGDIVSSPIYFKILISMVGVGCIVVIKRVAVAFMLGKKKYANYGPEMESIMRKVLLIAEVALHAEDIEFEAHHHQDMRGLSATHSIGKRGGWLFDQYGEQQTVEDQGGGVNPETESVCSTPSADIYEIKTSCSAERERRVEGGDDYEYGAPLRRLKWIPFRNKSKTKKELNKMLNSSSKYTELDKLLGEWEEPDTMKKTWERTSVKKILQFRQTLNYMGGTHPLSTPFGLANTRKACMISAQKVYYRLLMKKSDSDVLHFDTIMVLALDSDGKLQKEKARALIRLFRPDREGRITLVDFVRSCDRIYRRLKMFLATTSNSAQLDDAFEQLVNIIFYLVVTLVILSVFGVDLMSLFLSLTGILLPLSFLFGAAASNYFEGILLVLARQPYDIGDRIAISDPKEEVSLEGSPTWFVENITLFQTTVRMAATNEVATYANGSLASLRIINAARSPKAIVRIFLKFGLNVPYQKVKIFGNVVERFVNDRRPREWLRLICIRAVAVEADLGYIKYVVVLQHVESWQNVIDVLQSKAALSSFCLEVSKKMEMRYIAPPMPVELNLGDLSHDGEKVNSTNHDRRYDDTPQQKHSRIDSACYHTIATLFHRSPEEPGKKHK